MKKESCRSVRAANFPSVPEPPLVGDLRADGNGGLPNAAASGQDPGPAGWGFFSNSGGARIEQSAFRRGDHMAVTVGASTELSMWRGCR